MEVKPGYKQTEVGVIPEDWEVKRLGDIGTALIGLTYSPANVDSDGLLVLRSSNIVDGRLIFEDNVFVKMEVPDKIIVREGDILICVRNGSRNLIGKCAKIDKRTAGMTFGAFMAVFRTDIHNFVFYQFQSRTVEKQIHSYLGATINQITNASLNSFLIPLPPTLAEQEAIAEALSDADAFVESLEHLIAKKRQVKQGAMQELLTGKKRLPGFSGEWEVKTFSEIFDYYSTASNSRSDLVDDGDTYYIHYGDIHTRFHNHLDFTVDQPPKIKRSKCPNATLIKNGDWIMVDASEDLAGVSKSIEILGLREDIAAVSGLHTILLREKSPTFVPGFKGHLGNLKSLHDQYLHVATGMKVFGVSKTALRDLLLSIPSPPEQTAIAAILSDIDAEITALEAKLDKARQIKQGMMQELLTGRIRLV